MELRSSSTTHLPQNLLLDIVTSLVFCFNRSTGSSYVFESFEYIDRHILSVGLSGRENRRVLLYDYNTETSELQEVQDIKETHHEFPPFKLHLLGKSLYYIGQNGRLMCVSLIN